MGQFMIRRTFYALVTLFILSLTIFTVVRLTGDPVTLLAEPGARAEDLDRVRVEWGLDRPWPIQYLAFAKNIFTGQLGKSFNYQMPVSTLYFQRLPNSLELALAATLISFFIGIPAGIISAARVNSGWDSFGKVVALLGLSIPGFWLGLVMILTFSVWLHWLPTSGQGGWRNLIMPAVALGWYFAASLLRLTRSSMLEVLRSEYVKLARLKGLPGYVVLAVYIRRFHMRPSLYLDCLAFGMVLVGYAVTAGGFLLQLPVEHNVSAIELTWNFTTLNVALMTAGIFLLFRNLQPERGNSLPWRLTADISRKSYGIYLAHIILLNAMHTALAARIPNAFLRLPTIALATFVTTYLAIKILSLLPKSKFLIG